MTAEFVGTFIVVFFGVGAVNAAALSETQMGIWQVAVVWAVGVSLGIHASASLSGAHINPAITAAMVDWGGFPVDRVAVTQGRELTSQSPAGRVTSRR
jgi:glycerol uptake facilitator protein